jgi:hypothetical protein
MRGRDWVPPGRVSSRSQASPSITKLASYEGSLDLICDGGDDDDGAFCSFIRNIIFI